MQTLKNKKQSNKRTIWLIVSGVVLVIILYTASAHALSWWPFTYTSISSSQNQNPSTTKQSTKSTDVKSPADKVPKQYDTPKGSSQSENSLTGTINYSSVVEGETLVIRATINQRPSDGSCQLTLTNKATGQTVVKSANIIANPSSSTCNGFDIPVSQLESGSWNITIDLTSGNKNGQITGSAEV